MKWENTFILSCRSASKQISQAVNHKGLMTYFCSRTKWPISAPLPVFSSFCLSEHLAHLFLKTGHQVKEIFGYFRPEPIWMFKSFILTKGLGTGPLNSLSWKPQHGRNSNCRRPVKVLSDAKPQFKSSGTQVVAAFDHLDQGCPIRWSHVISVISTSHPSSPAYNETFLNHPSPLWHYTIDWHKVQPVFSNTRVSDKGQPNIQPWFWTCDKKKPLTPAAAATRRILL